ncbi:MAG: SMC-Scp complex subunit ScpB [Candidatus Bathyarchaeota archaeon]|nr:SMC-Scp complex subunit ScpB [Candidatus Bathyarchaeota archaeon]
MTIPDKRLVKLAELEAALYSAGHPLDMEELMQALGSRSEKIVLRYVEELAGKLRARGCALEVKTLPGNRAVIQLRPEYGKMVRQFTNRPLLTVGPLKTLGYIAYNQPIEQAQVLDYRGVHVYTQLKLLEDMALISRERTERGVVIKTTPFFADYFDLSPDPGKSRLQIIELFSNLHPELVARG